MKGRCGGCGRTYQLTARGLVRAHHVHTYGPYCPGGGMPALGADEPSYVEQIRDLTRERDDLRRALHVADLRLQAAEARGAAGGHMRTANRALLEAMRCLMDYDEEADKAREARWQELRDSIDRISAAPR